MLNVCKISFRLCFGFVFLNHDNISCFFWKSAFGSTVPLENYVPNENCMF
jgi:hypothetical protein